MKNKNLKKILLVTCAALSLSACSTMGRLSDIGTPPDMSHIDDKDIRLAQKPIRLPMPEDLEQSPKPNSIWQASRTTFFEDQRASEIGDILTVVIEIDEEAEIDNSSSRTRTSSEDSGASNLLGYENFLDQIFADGVSASDLVTYGTSSSYAGDGEIEREEKITMSMAAMVTQKLPNGNFIIHGKQELLVNFEKRVLQVDGVIRPEDITMDNQINYDKIAQARIVYGGEGQITDVQQPRYGQQIYDVIFPF